MMPTGVKSRTAAGGIKSISSHIGTYSEPSVLHDLGLVNS